MTAFLIGMIIGMCISLVGTYYYRDYQFQKFKKEKQSDEVYVSGGWPRESVGSAPKELSSAYVEELEHFVGEHRKLGHSVIETKTGWAYCLEFECGWEMRPR